MRENVDQNNSEYAHFYAVILVKAKTDILAAIFLNSYTVNSYSSLQNTFIPIYEIE